MGKMRICQKTKTHYVSHCSGVDRKTECLKIHPQKTNTMAMLEKDNDSKTRRTMSPRRLLFELELPVDLRVTQE